jgi:hypothetical protein
VVRFAFALVDAVQSVLSHTISEYVPMTVVMNPSSERRGSDNPERDARAPRRDRIKRPAKRNAIDRVTTGEPGELKDFQALKSAEEGYCRVVRFCREACVGHRFGAGETWQREQLPGR